MTDSDKRTDSAELPQTPEKPPKKKLSLAMQRTLCILAAVLALAVAGHFLFLILNPSPAPSQIQVDPPETPPAPVSLPLPQGALVRSGETEVFKYDVYETYICITKCLDRSAATLTVPDEIEGLPVLAIGAHSFENCSLLTQLTLPQNLRFIGEFGFASCTALYTLSLPDTLHEIDAYAFFNCISLTELSGGTLVQTLGEYAFDETPFLTFAEDEFLIFGDGVLLDYNGEGGNIAIPSTVKKIASLGENNLISELYVPQGVTELGAYSFCGCDNLTNLTLPLTLRKIGTQAFSGCTSLTKLALPDGLEAVGDGTFSYCENLKSVRYPASVTTIGADQFVMTDTIETIYVYPDSFAESYFKSTPYAEKVNAESE